MNEELNENLTITGPIKDKQLREKIAKQYIPLLHKIANQMILKKPEEMDFQDILGFGNEGMVYAMNTYNSEKGLSFQQYLGWCIRNKILSGINEEGHTIKFSAYAQNKAKLGKSEYISTVSMSSLFSNDDDDKPQSDRLPQIGDCESNKSDQSVWEKVCEWARKNFSERDSDMFIRFYGLDGQEPEEGKKLASKWGVSSCCVSVSKKKIIDAIKKSKELKDLLSDLL